MDDFSIVVKCKARARELGRSLLEFVPDGYLLHTYRFFYEYFFDSLFYPLESELFVQIASDLAVFVTVVFFSEEDE